jgi:hypothetical protein
MSIASGNLNLDFAQDRPTHDDQRIWAMVTFLQKLPELTPKQYQMHTARGDMDDSARH